MSHRNVKDESVPQEKGGSNETLINNNISKEVAELRKIVFEMRDKHF